MAVSTAAASASGGPALLAGLAGLLGFAVLAGFGLAVGELDAMIVSMAMLVAVATLVDFRIGAVVLLVLLPVQGNVYFPNQMFGITGLNPLNLLVVATLGSCALHGALGRGFVPKPLAWLFIVPILVAGLIGMPYADDVFPFFYDQEVVHYTNAIGYLRDAAIKPLLFVVIALLIAAAVKRSHRPERFLGPIIFAVWVMSLTAIIFVATSGINLGLLATTAARGFFSAMGMHANDLGRLYAMAYALLLFTWWETKDTALKSVLFVTMGVLVFALLLTFSRGAFLGFMVINALFVLWKFSSKTLMWVVVIGVPAILVLPGFVISRVTLGFAEGDMNAVSAGRIEGIWQPLLPWVMESPLWGHGLDSIVWAPAMWAEQMLTVTHPHSAYLQALVDMGILGLGLLVAYYWHVWKKLRDLGGNPYLSPTMRGFFQGAAAGLICFAVSGWAGSSLRPTAEFSFLWIAIGIMYGTLARKPAD